MKTKIYLKAMGLLILTVSLFVISSCSKNSNEGLSKEQKDQQNLEASAIDDKNYTESDEDLSTVDYKEFYDLLSSNGEWVQVNPEDIGLKPKTALNNHSSKNSFSLSNIFGIKDAYSSTEDLATVYVWKPSLDLGVVKVEGEAPVFTPYTNGQWVNSDAGWYFKAPTPVEETVSHYGRWVNSPTAGWMWVPGRVWSPAWVDWKQNDDYVSWAPLPPASYIVNNAINTPVIDDNNYFIVNKQNFLEPSVYKYSNIYYENGSTILARDLKRTDGVVIVNNTIINRGPDVNVIQTIYGRPVDLVKIQRVKNFKEVKYSDKEYSVFYPGFKKYKSKDNSRFTINEPKSYKKYSEWKDIKNQEKQYNKEVKKQEKEIRKEEKEIIKGNRNNENGNRNSGNENIKYENEKRNQNNENGNRENENKGKGNKEKNKGNENGNENNGKKNK